MAGPLCSGCIPWEKASLLLFSHPQASRLGPSKDSSLLCRVLTLLYITVPQQASSDCRVCPLSVSFVEVAGWCSGLV